MKPLLLVDGYNVIGAWTVPQREHLTIEESRDRLIHMIADYAGYSGEEVIVVFDGHYTDRPMSTRIEQYGIQESADNSIAASCEAAPKWRKVRVATSDAVEQTVTMGRGAVRISSREFLMELSQVRTQGKRTVAAPPSRGDLLTRLTPQQREIFDRMRKGEAEE